LIVSNCTAEVRDTLLHWMCALTLQLLALFKFFMDWVLLCFNNIKLGLDECEIV